MKHEAWQQAGDTDSFAQLSQAVNTLMPVSGGWRGYNTDVSGIIQSFANHLPSTDEALSGVIFGAGATGASALLAFQQLGLRQITVISRRPDPQQFPLTLWEHLGEYTKIISWADTAKVAQCLNTANLVMNTVPGPAQEELPLGKLTDEAVLMDAVYSPYPTPIVSWAKRHNATVIPGWEMLLYQGIAQVELFTGQSVAVELIRAQLEAAIAPCHSADLPQP